MIRRVQLSINNANIGKLNKLDKFRAESIHVINLYINLIWEQQDFSSKFISTKADTWLSARMQQCLGKQALEIVKSQRKRKRKTKPTFSGNSFNIDSRFVNIQFDNNSFDVWVKLSSLGNKIILNLPAHKHRQFFKYKEWKLKQSIRLRFSNNNYFVDLYYEKEPLPLKTTGNTKAIDIGYKKLIVSSDREFIGNTFIYEKISRKKQGSKAFNQALIERDELINKACKQLDLNNTNVLYAEDLKSVKHGSKGKIHKSFMNKLQRWSYSKVLNRLSMLCDESGIQFVKLSSQYTSQRCSKCGVICKSNRQGEIYKCACGNIMDADLNAAYNILHLGEYGLQVFKPI